MGTARSAQLALERAAEVERKQLTSHKERELRRKQEVYEAQLSALKGQSESERDAILRELNEEQKRLNVVADQRLEIARLRKADDGEVQIEENGAGKARKGSIR